MRTQEEIVARIRRLDSWATLFGFHREVLVPYLDDKHAKPFLKESTTEWDGQDAGSRDEVIAEMAKYMAFALSKVEDHRGISAIRSVEKMQCWLWLLGDNEALAFAEDSDNYPQYGAPILRHICKKYDLPQPTGTWWENMSTGRPCGAGSCGCGE